MHDSDKFALKMTGVICAALLIFTAIIAGSCLWEIEKRVEMVKAGTPAGEAACVTDMASGVSRAIICSHIFEGSRDAQQ